MKTSDDLFSYLETLSIKVQNVEHEPVFTVAESQSLRGALAGGHTKNLFLKDKKGRYFLLTVLQDAEIDLKQIHHKIGAKGRVSFGNPEALKEYLGVLPGSVTALGIINDVHNHVTLVLDERLMQHEIINCHPLRNNATVSIEADDLKKFIIATGHELNILPLDEKTGP